MTKGTWTDWKNVPAGTPIEWRSGAAATWEPGAFASAAGPLFAWITDGDGKRRAVRFADIRPKETP